MIQWPDDPMTQWVNGSISIGSLNHWFIGSLKNTCVFSMIQWPDDPMTQWAWLLALVDLTEDFS
jgi:hypothetical protein